MSTDINYTKEAFLHPWNLTFLIVAVLSTFAIGLATGVTWTYELALLFIAAAELLFLGIVPRNPRFRRAIRSRQVAEHRKPPSQKEIFQHLSSGSQRRYARLRQLEDDIEANYRKLSYASQGLLDSHINKIDGLLDSFLNLLHQKERYQSYAEQSSEKEIINAMEELEEDMKDDPERVRSIKERRMHILEQRLNRFKKGFENLDVIKAQLETIEDVIKYIHEQSWTLQNPEEITFQLDTLLEEVEETQDSVREIEEVFSASPGKLLDDVESTLEEPTPSERAASEEASESSREARQRMKN